MTARILFRTDGGAAIGLGHLQRSLSLAEALRRSGASCFFLVHGDAAAVERARAAGFPAEPAEGRPGTAADTALCLDAAKRFACRAIVVDSYLTGAPLLSALRDAGHLVVAVDDLAEHEFSCHLVVSFGPHASSWGYTSSSGDTRFLLGPRYAILRPEFWDTPLPPPRDTVRNVLVTSGGADPEGAMPEWIRALDDVDAGFDVTAVVGPFFSDPAGVHEAAALSSRAVRVVERPPTLRPIMAAAGLAVTAAGQTLYELCALGVPAVAVEIAANQRPQLDAFAAAGTVVDAGRAGDAATPSRIGDAVGRLCADEGERRRISEAAREAVDRRGALAVAAEILAALGTL